jgi:DnaJ domain/Protein of unknown function (DUF1232)
MTGYLKILLIILLLLYIISPFDFLPDFIPITGWLDDAFLLGVFVYYLRRGRLPGFFSWRGKFSKADQDDNRRSDRAGGFEKEKADSGSESKAQTDLKDPYEILGVKPGASPEEIQAAYRRAAQAYHPDKVSHLGREFQELAQKKFIEIQEAYEKLLGKSG